MAPKHITLLGQIYPVVFNVAFKNRRDSAYVLVDNKPIISVYYEGGNLSDDSLMRAEAALKSYIENKGQWSLNPELYYSQFSCRENKLPPLTTEHYAQQLSDGKFDISLIEQPFTSVDVYEHNNTPHLCIQTLKNEKEKSFFIWEKALIKEIAIAFNKRQTLPHRKLTRETTSMHNILTDVF